MQDQLARRLLRDEATESISASPGCHQPRACSGWTIFRAAMMNATTAAPPATRARPSAGTHAPEIANRTA